MNAIKIAFSYKNGGRRNRHYVVISIIEYCVDTPKAEYYPVNLYGNDPSESIKLIKTTNFVSNRNNKVEVILQYNSGDILNKRVELTNLEQLPHVVKKNLTLQYQNYNIYREVPFLINYSLNRKNFNILSRQFICENSQWSGYYDLWIVEKPLLTFHLMKVTMSSTSNEIGYESVNLTIDNLSKLPLLIRIRNSSGLREVVGNKADEIMFTTINYSDSRDYKYQPGDVYKWIANTCANRIYTELPTIIHSCLITSKSTHLSYSLINIIMNYLLDPSGIAQCDQNFVLTHPEMNDIEYFKKMYTEDLKVRERYGDIHDYRTLPNLDRAFKMRAIRVWGNMLEEERSEWIAKNKIAKRQDLDE